MRKTLLSIFFAAASLAASAQTESAKHQVKIISSSFSLHGTTNLNAFECKLEQPVATAPIPVTSKRSELQIKFDGLIMKYPIAEFDCGLEAMSHDLKQTLKSDQYPFMSLQINSISIKQENQEIERLKVISNVTITIAGVSKNTTIEDGLVINRTEESLTFSGKQNLNMTDFRIEPPSKFFGMVKVNDSLNVSFEINMEARPVK